MKPLSPAFMRGPRRQLGAFWGNLVVVAALVMIALVGMRLVPVFIESYSVKESLNSMLEQDLSSLKKGQIREMLLKRFDISAVNAIKFKNFSDLVTIEKKKGKTRIHVKYRAERELIGNVGLVIDVEHEVEE